MSARRDWQQAYLKQAKADWDAYQRTRQPMWPFCYRLLFLQMATEKLGKALLVGGYIKFEVITSSHAAFVKFMRVVGNNRKVREAFGMKKSQFRLHFKQLLPLAYEIELLTPALAKDGSIPEYPWQDPSGNIFIPVDYSFPLIKHLQTPRGIQLLKYIEFFLLQFDELFA